MAESDGDWLQEDKMAAYAGQHGDTVAGNIIRQLRGGGGGGADTPYTRPFVGMLVPFGRTEGVTSATK